MRPNPFCQPTAPAWLAQDPIHEIPRLLERLLKFAEYVPELYEILPWLKDMSVWGLVQERMSHKVFSHASPSVQEATLTAFFAQVTQPVAAMIEALYVSPLLRETWTVEEILRRMAQSVGKPALPLDVVIGVCCFFWRLRASVAPRGSIRVQEAVWCIRWQQTTVQVRTAQGIQNPLLLLVNDEATGKILAFRGVQGSPEDADMLLTLFDALVFSSQDSRHLNLYPPAHLHVQHPLFPEIVQAGKSWGIEVEEVEPQEFAFVQQWERELSGRVLDPIQYLRVFDRACEQTFGSAPFLAKQQAARHVGQRMRLHNDPSWSLPSLREILPTYKASVGSDGTLLWHGWHYRDMEEDVLRYWSDEAVTIRPSSLSEAVIWVYWDQDILCCAQAEELRHKDGYYRPYWFPYPRLGE